MATTAEEDLKEATRLKRSWKKSNIVTSVLLASLVIFLFHILVSPFYFSLNGSLAKEVMSSKLHAELNASNITFLPLKDIRFAKTAMDGNTWFMSSVNDTYDPNYAEYLFFPSENYEGKLLCINTSTGVDGTKNSYALAWPEALPDSAILLKGLSFVSYTYYDFYNLWHGVSALAPFVGWSMRKGCLKPKRWILFAKGSLQTATGAWLRQLMVANFGQVPIRRFGKRNGVQVPYCFEQALVMRHDVGKMSRERRWDVFQEIRCKARSFCGIKPGKKMKDLSGSGAPLIRFTLLMRRGSRSFKDPQAVSEIFRKECEKFDGCVMKVAQSEDLSFCQQVKVLTHTDILASPHGAQMTNMIFMDRNSTVMEFFPKGWRELAGAGQYAFHWLAEQSGMNHPDAWWEKLDKKHCPHPENDHECWNFYKNGQLGHNETFFVEWARTVLNQVRLRKQQLDNVHNISSCSC
ncbi:hypothetical protein AKJ16_DCAP02486 [Drosera capensis]